MARPRYRGGEEFSFRIKRGIGRRDALEYLTARLSLPATWVERLLESERVKCDETLVAPGEEIDLQPDVSISVSFPKVWPPHMQPTELPLKIIYEDENFVVLDKPPGIVVHPARGHMNGGTLQNGMIHRYENLVGGEGVTIGPCHRLDMDTSGAIVFSLKKTAYQSITAQFADNHPHKEYLAVVDGEPDFEQTTVKAPLGVDPERPSCTAVLPIHEGGKKAQTDLYVIERGNRWAVVRAIPITGRPHQIRVHLKHLGVPVVGDGEYNNIPDRIGFPRQALHAAALTIRHPSTDEKMRFESPLPEDIRELLERLRNR